MNEQSLDVHYQKKIVFFFKKSKFYKNKRKAADN